MTSISSMLGHSLLINPEAEFVRIKVCDGVITEIEALVRHHLQRFVFKILGKGCLNRSPKERR